MLTYDYLKPATVEEAIKLLREHGEKAMLVAGGTDVMVGIRQKKFTPQLLISLRGIDGLDYIEPHEGGVRIGSLTTHGKIAESALIRGSFSALSDAVCRVGSVQIRNVATIGGNVSSALPSADSACPLLIFDGYARIGGSEGERIVPLDQFFVGAGKTTLARDEVLLELRMPAPPQAAGSCYKKVARREAMEIAMLGVALMLAVEAVNSKPLEEAFVNQPPIEELYAALDASEIYCRDARIGLGVVAPTPIRARNGEAILKGARITTEALKTACEAAANEARPRDTMRGTAWFRTEMVKVLPKRLALTCLERILFPGKEARIY